MSSSESEAKRKKKVKNAKDGANMEESVARRRKKKTVGGGGEASTKGRRKKQGTHSAEAPAKAKKKTRTRRTETEDKQPTQEQGGGGGTGFAMNVPSDGAQMVMRRFAVVTICKGVDNLLREFNELFTVCPKPTPNDYTFFKKNAPKNRYRDIFCLDKTRVRLNWPQADENDTDYQDYIHANWVTAGLPDMPRKIICTQAPMDNTTVDFWQMIWQEKCMSILMLCQVMEGGRKKCEQYWPAKPGDKMKFTVINIVVKNIDVQVLNEVQVTKLLMKGKSRDGTDREHVVVHVLWSGWPDKSVPLSATGAIRAIVRTQTMSPLVVHCSAGVGRTGTIVTIEASLRTLLAGQELSVYNIIKYLRSARYMACQTDLQYLYVHRAILAYITSKKVMTVMDLSKFVSDYTALVNERFQRQEHVEQQGAAAPASASHPPGKRFTATARCRGC